MQNVLSNRIALILPGLLMWTLSVWCQSSYVLPVEDEAIQYLSPPKDDPVARLQRRLNLGETQLEFGGPSGYLLSVLKELRVPVSSQMLVFSKTSFQQHRISPSTPRAIYFNDSVYIGWVRGGDVIEVSAVDPNRGAMFYTLDQKKNGTPQFARRDECLQCHASPKTLGVPGHLVRSVYPDSEGIPFLQAGSFLTSHNSPLKERWGGWYVTGTHGSQRHMGNGWSQDAEHPDRLDLDSGANVTSLKQRVDLSSYAGQDSDLVALMVLEHQTRMHNLLTKANWETRLALSQQEAINQAMHEPIDYRSESTKHRIEAVVEDLIEYLLFAEEAPLTEPVSGTSGFEKGFAETGPKDHLGRSLRDLDLKRRLFKYPCSFLIYSEAFDALPDAARDRVYKRLWEILTGEDRSPRLAGLSQSDRKAVLEILLETKSGLPKYWKSEATTLVGYSQATQGVRTLR